MTTVSPAVSTGRQSSASFALGPIGIALATGLVLAEAIDALLVASWAGLDVALWLGAARGTGLRRPRPRGLGLRAHLAGRAPAVFGPGPSPRRRVLPALRPGHRALHDLAQRGQRRRPGQSCPLARGPLDGQLAASGRRRRDPARHGPVQLAGPRRRSPHWRALATARLASLAGGAERPHLLPGSSAHAHQRVLAGHGARAGLDRRRSAGPRPHHRLCLSRYPAPHQREVVLRPARVGAGQPGLPPAPPLGGASGRQPGRRAHRVGPPGRPGPASTPRGSALRHRPGRTPGPSRAGRRAVGNGPPHGAPARSSLSAPLAEAGGGRSTQPAVGQGASARAPARVPVPVR